jgi:broad-specificity NMP kinase
MNAERNYLVRTVFPELKKKCEKHHVHLIDVDLRWGIPESDAQDGKALDICLDEIDFCRPYFLGLLGNRYGCIPTDQENSITAQEIYHAALHNYIPRQVINLQKIIGEDKYLTTDQINSLIRSYQWDGEKNKYLLKNKLSFDEAAIISSVFTKYSNYRNNCCFFLFRTESLTKELAGENKNDFFETNKENQEKLDALKQSIIDKRLSYYKYDDIETFGEKVKENVWRWIETDLEKPIKGPKDWIEEEEELHELFMADRTRRFVGRRDIIDKMHSFCERNEEPSVMIITGEPGSGKSALMSRFSEEAIRKYSGWLIIPHFIGASSPSTNIAQTLRRLCARLNCITHMLEEIPQDYKELSKVFPILLTKAAEQRKILIILDAITREDV